MAKLSAILCALAAFTGAVTAGTVQFIVLYVLKFCDWHLLVPLERRASQFCFVIGNVALSAEVESFLPGIASQVTCDLTKTTIDGVPDVISNGTRFSDINFEDSNLTPLEFALSEFATTEPLADNDLSKFQAQENVYVATEDGVRSVGGSLEIKDVRFFISFQIARIQTAQGISITTADGQVAHLLGKVLNNAGEESQATKDKVIALSTVLSWFELGSAGNEKVLGLILLELATA